MTSNDANPASASTADGSPDKRAAPRYLRWQETAVAYLVEANTDQILAVAKADLLALATDDAVEMLAERDDTVFHYTLEFDVEVPKANAAQVICRLIIGPDYDGYQHAAALRADPASRQLAWLVLTDMYKIFS